MIKPEQFSFFALCRKSKSIIAGHLSPIDLHARIGWSSWPCTLTSNKRADMSPKKKKKQNIIFIVHPPHTCHKIITNIGHLFKAQSAFEKRHPFGVQEKIVDLFVDIVALCEAAQLIILIFTNCTTVLSPFCIFCCCDEISNPWD